MRLVRLSGFVLAAAGAVSSANAAFVGGVIRENVKSSIISSSTSNGASRVYELFIAFDEADDILNSIGNSNLATSDGANLIQNGVFGSVQDTDGDLNPGAWGAVPESQWDSYVAIGGPFPGASATTTDPDFAFSANGVAGGWFDIPGDNGSRQGVAGNGIDLGDGLWGVFAGQFVLEGAGAGARGFAVQPGRGFVHSHSLLGVLDVNWIEFAGGVNIAAQEVQVGHPSPGAAGLFGCAGVCAARRRRGVNAANRSGGTA